LRVYHSIEETNEKIKHTGEFKQEAVRTLAEQRLAAPVWTSGKRSAVNLASGAFAVQGLRPGTGLACPSQPRAADSHTASLALTGSGAAVTARQEKIEPPLFGPPVLISGHQAAILRAPDPARAAVLRSELAAALVCAEQYA
jgi:hypothetical protein